MTIAGRKAGDLLERLLAVGRRLGDEAPALHQLLEADARRRIVLDDQHPLGRYAGTACFARTALSLTRLISSVLSQEPCHFYIVNAERLARCKPGNCSDLQ